MEEARLEGIRRAVQGLAALLYADDGILAYPHPDRLQTELDVL